MEEILAIDIQRSPREQEPQDNHLYLNSLEKSRGKPQGNQPAATVQKAQGAAATSLQAPLIAVHTGADPNMDPETQDPRTHHSSRGPTEARGPGPGRQPPGVSWHTPQHPAPNNKNHTYTSGQRHQPPTRSVARRK
ncbi:hypothetical protein AMECASPLE_023647 [Ameca splendens]|uniref:Uncharacterized protein n=1 Tax=Ameca splendens TaxID=208324 RepID=A0ABV0YFE7_9TELE